MRIAIISSRLPPGPASGAEEYVAQLAEALAERHEVVVFTGAAEGLPSVRCVRIPSLPHLQPTAPGISKVVWHLRDQWMPSVHRVLQARLRELSPDVVHTHEPQGLSAAVFSALAGRRLPHVHTAHDLNLLCVRTNMTVGGEFCGGSCMTCLLQRVVRGRLFRRHVHRLVAASDYLRDVHVRAGLIPAEAAVTIRQAARAGPARVRTVRDSGASLGFIGPLEEYKGLLTLLRAFHRAPQGWRLTIAGQGRLESAMRAAAAADPRIQFVGFVTGAAKDEFFDALDLLVVPSECEENAPLVAAEAAVRALPTVVSDRGGLRETPEARVFRARDEDSLLRELHWFLEQPDRLAAASRRLVENRDAFSWPNHVKAVEDVLRDAVLAQASSR